MIDSRNKKKTGDGKTISIVIPFFERNNELMNLLCSIYKIHYSNGIPISVISLMKKVPKRIFELMKRP